MKALPLSPRALGDDLALICLRMVGEMPKVLTVRLGVREMANLNKVMIIGNVGTDPEMRFTPNGNPVTTFRIATSRIFTSSEGERRQETEWFTVVTWNKLA